MKDRSSYRRGSMGRGRGRGRPAMTGGARPSRPAPRPKKPVSGGKTPRGNMGGISKSAVEKYVKPITGGPTPRPTGMQVGPKNIAPQTGGPNPRTGGGRPSRPTPRPKAPMSGGMGGGMTASGRARRAEGGKAYSNIREMEKACMSPDYNESMKEK